MEINEDKLFPLALAVIYGHKIMAQLIAKNGQTRREQTDINEWNILHFAARYDRLEILDMFIREQQLTKKIIDYA